MTEGRDFNVNYFQRLSDGREMFPPSASIGFEFRKMIVFMSLLSKKKISLHVLIENITPMSLLDSISLFRTQSYWVIQRKENLFGPNRIRYATRRFSLFQNQLTEKKRLLNRWLRAATRSVAFFTAIPSERRD